MEEFDLSKLKYKMPYQWRVQSIKEYGADCVAYIDARDVQDRLDAVVGIGGWQCDYKDVKGVVYCGIGIKEGEEWVWKWDAGSESNIEKEKGEASDSFKRAAVKWGIGRFLYDLEVVKLKVIKDDKGKLYPLDEARNRPIYGGSQLTNYINQKKGIAPVSQPVQKPAETKQQEPTKGEKQDLLKLAESSTLDTGKKAEAIKAIMECQDYATYIKLLHRLEDLQPSLDQIKNPSQKDLNKHLKTVQS